jgi:hypothetical protein
LIESEFLRKHRNDLSILSSKQMKDQVVHKLKKTRAVE